MQSDNPQLGNDRNVDLVKPKKVKLVARKRIVVREHGLFPKIAHPPIDVAQNEENGETPTVQKKDEAPTENRRVRKKNKKTRSQCSVEESVEEKPTTYESLIEVDHNHLYRCVLDPKGKKARVCIADARCIANPKYISRRSALEEHLLLAHNISCHVPGGFFMDKQSMDGHGIDKRIRDRFYDVERKLQVARKKYEVGAQSKALEAYKSLSVHNVTICEEEFIASYVQKLMNDYDGKKEERLKKIKQRISIGYEYSKRNGKVFLRNTNNPELVDGPGFEKTELNCCNEQNRTTPTNAKDTSKAEVAERCGGRSQNDYEKCNQEEAAYISSGDENCRVDARKIEVFHGSIFCSTKTEMSRFEVRCKRINVSLLLSKCEVHSIDTDGVETSTTMMSLFSTWLEFQLPFAISQDIWVLDPFWRHLKNAGKIQQVCSWIPPMVKILFFPVLLNRHWSLYVAINSSQGIVACGGIEGILFMDPRNGPIDKAICVDVQETCVEVWGEWRSAQFVQVETIKHIMIPQQPNGTDCGFYIMYCIQCLIEELLQGFHSTKFGTIHWFTHTDVQAMRATFCRWARRLAD